jgi:RasGEF domain/Putative GTPase activating protein for Arf
MFGFLVEDEASQVNASRTWNDRVGQASTVDGFQSTRSLYPVERTLSSRQLAQVARKKRAEKLEAWKRNVRLVAAQQQDNLLFNSEKSNSNAGAQKSFGENRNRHNQNDDDDELNRRVLGVLTKHGNFECADCMSVACRGETLRFLSANLGVLLCARCALVHRDFLRREHNASDVFNVFRKRAKFQRDAGLLLLLEAVDNEVVNARLWQRNVGDASKPPADAGDDERRDYARRKYLDREMTGLLSGSMGARVHSDCDEATGFLAVRAVLSARALELHADAERVSMSTFDIDAGEFVSNGDSDTDDDADSSDDGSLTDDLSSSSSSSPPPPLGNGDGVDERERDDMLGTVLCRGCALLVALEDVDGHSAACCGGSPGDRSPPPSPIGAMTLLRCLVDADQVRRRRLLVRCGPRSVQLLFDSVRNAFVWLHSIRGAVARALAHQLRCQEVERRRRENMIVIRPLMLRKRADSANDDDDDEHDGHGSLSRSSSVQDWHRQRNNAVLAAHPPELDCCVYNERGKLTGATLREVVAALTPEVSTDTQQLHTIEAFLLYHASFSDALTVLIMLEARFFAPVDAHTVSEHLAMQQQRAALARRASSFDCGDSGDSGSDGDDNGDDDNDGKSARRRRRQRTTTLATIAPPPSRMLAHNHRAASVGDVTSSCSRAIELPPWLRSLPAPAPPPARLHRGDGDDIAPSWLRHELAPLPPPKLDVAVLEQLAGNIAMLRKVRVLNLLKLWLRRYPCDFAGEQGAIARLWLVAFAEHVAYEHEGVRAYAAPASALRGELVCMATDSESSLSGSSGATVAATRDDDSISRHASFATQQHQVERRRSRFIAAVSGMPPGSPRHSSTSAPQLSAANSSNAVGNSVSLLERDLRHLAEQLCMRDSRLLKCVDLREFDMRWMGDGKHERAPGILRLIGSFNVLSRAFVSMILSGAEPRHRARAIDQVIALADHCLSLQNHHGAMQLYGTLTASAVVRLKRSWSHVPSRSIAVYDRLDRVLAAHKNFAELRAAMSSVDTTAGTVPYIGIFLSDIIFTDESLPTFVAASPSSLPADASSPKVINLEKLSALYRIVSFVDRCKHSVYTFDVDPAIQILLDELAATDEETLWRLSRRIEPKIT